MVKKTSKSPKKSPAPADITQPKSTAMNVRDDSEEEDIGPPPSISTPTVGVPVVRSSKVVKVNFGGKSSNDSIRAGSNSPAPTGKPLVHPSLSSDSLSSINSNEQLIQEKIAAVVGSGPSSPARSTGSNGAMPQYNNSLTAALGVLSIGGNENDEKDLISVSLGDGSTLVTQATTASGTSTNNLVCLDTLSSAISQKRPSSAMQLNTIRQLIEQYNAPNANINNLLPSTTTMMSYGYLIHSLWLRNWYDFVTLPTTLEKGAKSREPGIISNWELIDDKAGIQNWKTKTSSVLASSVSFTNLLDEPEGGQHSEYMQCRFKLRPNLQENMDFFILPKDAWEALYRWYGGGPPLPRFFDHALMKSPHFPFFYHLLDLLNSNANILAVTPGTVNVANTSAIQRNASRENAEQVMKQGGYSHAVEQDIYPVTATSKITDESNIPCVTDILDFQMKVKESEKVVNEEKGSDGTYSLEDEETKDPPSVTSETKDNGKVAEEKKSAAPTVPAMAPCAVCDTTSKNRCSQCSSVFYCSKECQKVHWTKHKKECKTLAAAAAASAKTNQLSSSSSATDNSKDKRRGKVGLNNLGNSCYMNSSLQCLSHIKPLTNFFISNRYEDEINVQNRDGTKGELVRTYASLLQDLWINTPSNVLAPGTNPMSSALARMNALTPKRFKSVLGRVNPEYAGVDQHDAHEVIEQLLDKMHEDLNRISKKPYVENLEGDGTNDSTIARDTWKRHCLREDSMVKDTVGGLMRSQLNCPTCGKVSVAYEYHNTVQIAIPRNYHITVTVVFIPEIPSDRCPPFVNDSDATNIIHQWDRFKPKKIAITLDRLCTIKALKKMLRDEGHIPKDFLHLCQDDLIMLESACGNVKVSAPSVGGRKSSFAEEEEEEDDGSKGIMGSAGKTRKRTSSLAVRNTKGKPKSIIALNDTKTVSAIGGQSIVYCYATCHTQTDLAIVHMRKFEDGVVENLLSANTADEQTAMMEQIEYFGFPLLLSYDSRWPVRRLQYHVWLNIIRFLSTDSDYVQHSLQLLKENNMVEQFQLSASVHIRTIRSDGRSYFHKVGSKSLDTQSLLLGIELCKDQKKQIGTFCSEIGLNGLATGTGVLAVDFASDLASLIDVHMLEQLELNIVVAANKPGLNRNRVRHNSTILTLEECLAEHTKEETLDANNEWYCNVCKEHKRAQKIVSFCPDYLPKVLILSLKRFEFRSVNTANTIYGGYGGYGGQMMHREKIDTYVDFPLKGLNVKPYCQAISLHSPQNDVPPETVEDDDGILYDLFAVCNHYGRMGFGHYTAIARDWDYPTDSLGDQWYMFDDHAVTPIAPKEVKTPSAYILFYRRRG